MRLCRMLLVTMLVVLLPGVPARAVPPGPRNLVLDGTLPLGNRGLAPLLIDGLHGYAYIGTSSSSQPAVWRVRLSDLTAAGSTIVGYDNSGLYAGVLDPEHDNSYWAVRDYLQQLHIMRMRLSTFSWVDTLDLTTTDGAPGCSVIDPLHRRAYFATDRGYVIAVNLDSFTRGATATLQADEHNIRACAIDAYGVYAYIAAGARIVKVRLVDMRRVGAVDLPDGEISTLEMDAAGAYLYAGTWTGPGRLVRVRVQGLMREAALILNAGENEILRTTIDPATNRAYVALNYPQRVIQVRLPELTRIGMVLLDRQNDFMGAGVDSRQSYVYFSTWTYQEASLLQRFNVRSDGVLALNGTPDPVPAGGLLRYDASMHTNGPDDLVAAVLTVTLPLSTSVQAVSAGCSHGSGRVVCLLGTLPYTSTLTARVWLQVAPGISGTLTATAELRAANFDPAPANNVVTATTGIQPVVICCRQYLPATLLAPP